MDRRRLSPGQSQAKGQRKGDVLDVQVRRTYLTAASDEEVREAQKAVQEITDRLGELTDQGKVIDQRRKHLESIRVFALDKLPKDAATRQVKVTEYSEFLTFLETSLTKLNADRRALEIKSQDLQPEQKRPAEKAQRIELQSPIGGAGRGNLSSRTRSSHRGPDLSVGRCILGTGPRIAG